MNLFRWRRSNYPQPFTDRVVVPLMRRLGEMAAALYPQNAVQQTQKLLELAGNPGRMDASTFMVLHFVAAVLFGALVFVLTLFSQYFYSPH